MKNLLVFILIFFNSVLLSQVFTEIDTGFPGVYGGSVEWGDYDNDGDLDLLLTGNLISKIYRNDSGIFTDINAGLIEVAHSSVDWGDYDNDGDLDILITGSRYINTNWEKTASIYQNNSGVFTDINAGLTGIDTGSADWGDYDNDGDLDILITGYADSFVRTVKIYNNDDGIFTDINAELKGVCYSSADWGDYDNDGDLDVLIAGEVDGFGDNKTSKIYRNDSGFFTDINAGLTGDSYGSVEWGDYDNDGDLDILIEDTVYRNDSGIFTDINAGLIADSHSSSWADFENDGDLDILITGWSDSDERITKIYRNISGVFMDNINTDLTGVNWGATAWGDYDNDGDLDIIITGATTGLGFISKLYRNNRTVANVAPDSPSDLSYSINNNEVELSWNKASDNETPQNGLSYNIYLGTESLVPDIMSPMSDIIDGYRLVAKSGNVCNNNSWILRNLASGTYYFSVQTVDNIYSGSLFSAEQTFTYNAPLSSAPVAVLPSDIGFYNCTANWNNADFVKGYYLDVATDSLFINFMPGFENLDVYNVLSYDISGLSHDTEYYYRVRSYNGDHIPSNSSNTISLRTQYKQFNEITTNITNVSNGKIEWGDYDNDGDLDILLAGADQSYNYISKIYRNDSGLFIDINAGLFTHNSTYLGAKGSASWGDYDNDGDLDILLTGNYYQGELPDFYFVSFTYIYRNDSGIFTRIYIDEVSGSAAWGDYDNDGDLDFIIGNKIYNNDSGIFTDVTDGLEDLYISSIAWGDYDNDGDLDILLSGVDQSNNDVSTIYRNDSGIFTNIYAGLTGVSSGSAAWGDYDNDGDLDLFLTGWTGSQNQAFIYRNDSGVFTNINSDIIGVVESSVAWGDFDNDGDLDLLLSGRYYDGHWNDITRIYQNNSGVFTDINDDLEGFSGSSVAWGDYDNDGDLDILQSGAADSGCFTKLYENSNYTSNTIPNIPINLSSSVNSNVITFNWGEASDNETPQDGLSYNLYIGTTIHFSDKMSPMSDITTGCRKIVKSGNAGQTCTWSIENLPAGTYYWSVQSIDNCFAGSPFAPEQTFTVSGIEDDNLPFVTAVYQNYPNPFNPETVIKYSLEKNSQVSLKIYDIAGREVFSLVNMKQNRGYHVAKFNADNLTSGLYFYQLKVDGVIIANRKMMMVK